MDEAKAKRRKTGNGEGSAVFDAQRNRWIVRATVNGRRTGKLARKTKAEANKLLRDLLHANDEGATVTDGTLTVRQVLDRWEQRSVRSRNLAPATVEAYRWCAERLRAEIGGKKVRGLTVDDVERCLDRMAAGEHGNKPASRETLIKMRSTLAQALAHAEKRKQVLGNVARLADLPPDARRTPKRRSMTLEEARRFLTALRGTRREALFVIMISTGLRPGEVAALSWDDVDLQSGHMAIWRGRRMVAGRPEIVDELKTAKSRRTITLPPVAIDALCRHRLQDAPLRPRGWVDKGLIFPNSTGGVLERRTMSTDLCAVTVAAGLGIWTPNELRHTAASLLSAAGVPLEQIADLLGHTNTRMLEQTYRHSVQTSIEAAVAPMERLFATTDDLANVAHQP